MEGCDGKRDNSFLRKDSEGKEREIRLGAYPSYWGGIK